MPFQGEPHQVTTSGKKLDPNWYEVAEYTKAQNQPESKPNAALLATCLANADAGGLPAIYASPLQAKFLALQARALGAARFLELGTLGGYTSLWLTSLNPDLRVTTVEVDAHHAATARKSFAAAGKQIEERIELLEGAGLDVLPKVLAECQEGKREPFDLVFIDADKVNNWNYFDKAVQMTRKGGIVYVDNVVRGGKIVHPDYQDDQSVKGAREVIEKSGADSRVESTVIQLCDEKGFDGMVMAVVN
jgi:predicted O-methyltransferase YrrM